MVELKPCPFCGERAAVIGRAGLNEIVKCMSCGAWQGSVRLWNVRPPETALLAQIAALRHQVTELQAQHCADEAMRTTQRVTFTQDGRKVER